MIDERTIRDPNTEDLKILDMLEDFLKSLEQIQLSHPELNKLENPFYKELKETMSTLIKFALYKFDQFLDLSYEHYDLRKRLSNNNPPCYSDFADNNTQ